MLSSVLSRWHRLLFLPLQKPLLLRFDDNMASTAVLTIDRQLWNTLHVNNSVDNWHGEYFTASPLCMCNSRFRQHTLIELCIQYSWTESWTCIVRPSTLQFHLAASRSSLFQAISLVGPNIFGPWVVDCKSSTICNVSHLLAHLNLFVVKQFVLIKCTPCHYYVSVYLSLYRHFLCASCNILCSFLFSCICSHIDPELSKPIKVYPLPHMYVVKDLVPVSCTCSNARVI